MPKLPERRFKIGKVLGWSPQTKEYFSCSLGRNCKKQMINLIEF